MPSKVAKWPQKIALRPPLQPLRMKGNLEASQKRGPEVARRQRSEMGGVGASITPDCARLRLSYALRTGQQPIAKIQAM